MKLRCIYCAHTWEPDERPPACPGCSTPFTLTITPETTIFDLAMAVDRNGFVLDFDLQGRPEPRPSAAYFALADGPAE